MVVARWSRVMSVGLRCCVGWMSGSLTVACCGGGVRVSSKCNIFEGFGEHSDSIPVEVEPIV